MEVVLRGQLMNVSSKDWIFEGKNGTTYTLVLYCDDVLYKIKIKPSDVNYYRDLIGQEVAVNCKLFCEGRFSLTLV